MRIIPGLKKLAAEQIVSSSMSKFNNNWEVIFKLGWIYDDDYLKKAGLRFLCENWQKLFDKKKGYEILEWGGPSCTCLNQIIGSVLNYRKNRAHIRIFISFERKIEECITVMPLYHHPQGTILR